MLQGGEEAEGKLEVSKIYGWSHGDVIMEIAAVTSPHSIGDAMRRNSCIGSEAEIVDNGEEHCDVFGEGLVRLKFSDGVPELGCHIPLFAPDNCPP